MLEFCQHLLAPLNQEYFILEEMGLLLATYHHSMGTGIECQT